MTTAVIIQSSRSPLQLSLRGAALSDVAISDQQEVTFRSSTNTASHRSPEIPNQVQDDGTFSLPPRTPPNMTPLQTLANSVASLLKERGDTVAVAESSSGGLISAALLAIPGASAYFMGGSVVYTKTARDEFLGIDFDNHPGMRSASEPYALLLAKTSREKLATTWGLAETGASGPTGNPYGDNPGHTCTAVVGESLEAANTLETGKTDREANMQSFAETALAQFENILKTN